MSTVTSTLTSIETEFRYKDDVVLSDLGRVFRLRERDMLPPLQMSRDFLLANGEEDSPMEGDPPFPDPSTPGTTPDGIERQPGAQFRVLEKVRVSEFQGQKIEVVHVLFLIDWYHYTHEGVDPIDFADPLFWPRLLHVPFSDGLFNLLRTFLLNRAAEVEEGERPTTKTEVDLWLEDFRNELSLEEVDPVLREAFLTEFDFKRDAVHSAVLSGYIWSVWQDEPTYLPGPPDLHFDDANIYVSTLQTWLALAGHDPMTRNGIFDDDTRVALAAYKDGIYDDGFEPGESGSPEAGEFLSRQTWYRLEHDISQHYPRDPATFSRTAYPDAGYFTDTDARDQALVTGLKVTGIEVDSMNEVEVEEGIRLFKSLSRDFDTYGFSRVPGEIKNLYPGLLDADFLPLPDPLHKNSMRGFDFLPTSWNNFTVSWGRFFGAPWMGVVVDPPDGFSEANGMATPASPNQELANWSYLTLETMNMLTAWGEAYLVQGELVDSPEVDAEGVEARLLRPIPVRHLSRSLGQPVFNEEEFEHAGLGINVHWPIEDAIGVRYYDVTDPTTHKPPDFDRDQLVNFLRALAGVPVPMQVLVSDKPAHDEIESLFEPELDPFATEFMPPMKRLYHNRFRDEGFASVTVNGENRQVAWYANALANARLLSRAEITRFAGLYPHVDRLLATDQRRIFWLHLLARFEKLDVHENYYGLPSLGRLREVWREWLIFASTADPTTEGYLDNFLSNNIQNAFLCLFLKSKYRITEDFFDEETIKPVFDFGVVFENEQRNILKAEAIAEYYENLPGLPEEKNWDDTPLDPSDTLEGVGARPCLVVELTGLMTLNLSGNTDYELSLDFESPPPGPEHTFPILEIVPDEVSPISENVRLLIDVTGFEGEIPTNASWVVHEAGMPSAEEANGTGILDANFSDNTGFGYVQLDGASPGNLDNVIGKSIYLFHDADKKFYRVEAVHEEVGVLKLAGVPTLLNANPSAWILRKYQILRFLNPAGGEAKQGQVLQFDGDLPLGLAPGDTAEFDSSSFTVEAVDFGKKIVVLKEAVSFVAFGETFFVDLSGGFGSALGLSAQILENALVLDGEPHLQPVETGSLARFNQLFLKADTVSEAKTYTITGISHHTYVVIVQGAPEFRTSAGEESPEERVSTSEWRIDQQFVLGWRDEASPVKGMTATSWGKTINIDFPE